MTTRLHVAFVAHSKRPDLFMNDPSFIYRCENLALALQGAGHHTELVHYTQFNPSNHYDVVVFHRPKHRFGFARMINKLRKRGVRVIADFDDLIIDPQYAEFSPGVINGQVSLEQTQKTFGQHAKALKQFERVSVSTSPLINKMQLHTNADVLMLPNSPHLSWPTIPITSKPERPRLTYFPGTRSHDKDFALIAEPLQDFLTDHQDVQLQITGPLSQEIQARPDQLLCFEKQPFSAYHTHVASSWLNLAPLEYTLFNAHKSALKTIEAAYYHAPTLASPIPDMQRLEGKGSILVPWENGDWYAALKTNLQTPAELSAMLLQQKLLATENCIHFARQWLEWLGYPELATHLIKTASSDTHVNYQ